MKNSWEYHFPGTQTQYHLLMSICEEIDFTTPKQKYIMGQIIGIFG